MRRVVVVFAVLVGAALAGMLALFLLRDSGSGEALHVTERATGKRTTPHAPDVVMHPTVHERLKLAGSVRDGDASKPISGARLGLYALAGPPLPDHTLDLRGLGRSLGTVRTAKDGTFKLSAPGVGRAILQAEAPGYVPVRYVVTASKDDYDIQLQRGNEVTIHVRDRQRRPVPSAEALLFPEQISKAYPALRFHADQEGDLKIAWPRCFVVRIRAPGYAEASPSRTLEQEIEVRLEREFQLAGRVLDEEGKPVSRALVHLDPDRAQFSDSGGRFRFTGLASGTCGLSVKARGFAAFEVLAETGDDHLKVLLRRPVVLRGKVVLPDGSPAAGAKLVVSGQDGVVYGRDGELRSAKNGDFECDGLPPPSCYVEASWGKRITRFLAPYRATATVSLPGPALTLHLRRMSFLRLRFVDEENALDSSWGLFSRMPISNCDETSEGDVVASVYLPPGGEFHGTAASHGRYYRELPFNAPLLESPASPATLIRVPACLRLTLVVRGPRGERLPERVSVTVDPRWQAWLDSGAPQERDRFQLLVDLSVPDTPPSILVTAPGYVSEERVLRPETDDSTMEVDLQAGASLVGRLLWEDGTPVPSGYVHVLPTQTEGSGYVEDDGSFEVDGIAPGAHDVFAGQWAHTARAHRKLAFHKGAELDIGDWILRPRVELRGHVVDAEGKPLGGVRVVVSGDLPDGAPGERTTHADGSYRVEVAQFLSGRLVFSKAGYGQRLLPFKSGPSRTLPVADLPGEGFLHLSIKLGPSPDLDWVLRLSKAGVSWTWSPDWSRDSDGYIVRKLPPGALVVILEDRKTHARLAQQEVEIEVGKVTTAEMTLPSK